MAGTPRPMRMAKAAPARQSKRRAQHAVLSPSAVPLPRVNRRPRRRPNRLRAGFPYQSPRRLHRNLLPSPPLPLPLSPPPLSRASAPLCVFCVENSFPSRLTHTIRAGFPCQTPLSNRRVPAAPGPAKPSIRTRLHPLQSCLGSWVTPPPPPTQPASSRSPTGGFQPRRAEPGPASVPVFNGCRPPASPSLRRRRKQQEPTPQRWPLPNQLPGEAIWTIPRPASQPPIRHHSRQHQRQSRIAGHAPAGRLAMDRRISA